MPYSCKICQISFQKLRDHRAHITAFQGGKKYIKCCVCDAKFSYGNFRTLKRHISAVHAIESYRCPFCTNCFLVKEELEKYITQIIVPSFFCKIKFTHENFKCLFVCVYRPCDGSKKYNYTGETIVLAASCRRRSKQI